MSAPLGSQAGKRPVSPRQLQILRIIERWVAERGFPPTYQEFTVELGLSKRSRQTIHEHLCRLVAKDLLIRHPGIARGISITAAGRELLARLAANPPALGATA